MDIAVRHVNSVDTNYGMALKNHTYTVVTGYIEPLKLQSC